jgi:hypothetical protein
MSKALLEVKRKHLEADLDLRIKQFATVSETRLTTLNPGDRVLLDEQLRMIELEIDKVDAKLKAILRQLDTVVETTSANKTAAKNARLGQSALQIKEKLGTGKKRAVLVGVNQYEDDSNYGELSVCVQDVEAIQKKITGLGYADDRVRILTDNSGRNLPTRNRVIATLRSFAKVSEPNDLFLFYYSGHGDMEDGESYLVCRDGFSNSLKDTAIPVKLVEQIMRAAAARAKVIILDSCHSGAALGAKGSRKMSAEYIKRVFEEAEGLAVLSSCKQDEQSYVRPEEDASAFTHYLLEGLTGKADTEKKGFVTVQDMNHYVSDKVKDWAAGQNLTQTPVFSAAMAGDIILIDHRNSSRSQKIN